MRPDPDIALAPPRPGATWLSAPVAAAIALMTAIALTGSNTALFLLLNHAGAAVPDGLWIALTLLGDGAVALMLILLLAGRTPQRMWAAILAALLATLWVQVWKHTLILPRPAAVLEAGTFFHIGPLWRARAFPSGHTAAAFAFVGVVIFGARLSLAGKLALFAGAALVALSRIMVGMHWPIDVLGGLVGGWCAAWLGWRLAQRPFFGRWGRSAQLAALCLALIAAGLLFIDHTHYPGAMPLQRALAVVCLLFALRQALLRRAQRRSQAGQRRRAADLARS